MCDDDLLVYRTRAFKSATPKSNASETPTMKKPQIGLLCFPLDFFINVPFFFSTPAPAKRILSIRRIIHETLKTLITKDCRKWPISLLSGNY
jgi:hypothetical protein